MRVPAFRDAAEPGITIRTLFRRVGQPYLRRDRAHTFCARTADDPEVRMAVDLDRRGRVVGVRRLR
jgi:hypothetical protein